jgi:small nuclear ribonucleoprotein (snRNP)-like protein
MWGVRQWLLAATLLPVGAVSARPQESEQVRIWILTLPQNAEVTVTLKTGEVVEGRLAETEAARFALWVALEEAEKEKYRSTDSIQRWIAYDEVASPDSTWTPVATSAEGLAYRFRIGDQARVRTSEGEVLTGKIQDFDGQNLRLDGRTWNLSEGDVAEIELRDSDPVTNGALIGLGIGVGLVALACTAGCDASIAVAGALVYGGAGAGLGALFDSMKKSYSTIYVRPGPKLIVLPLPARDGMGLLVSVRF